MITRITCKARTVATVAIASATLGLMAANVAHADSDSADSNHVVTSVKVVFPDLDLGTPKGSKLLFMRLQDAAETVCGDDLQTVVLIENRDIWRCQQEAIEGAVARIDRPLLTALYDRHFPHEPLEGGSRVSFAPGEVSAPVRVEVINVTAARRG